MNHGSLFSGIGGFELAAEWMGWNNCFSCDIEPFAQKILKYYWPNAEHYEDIKQTDFTIWRGRIDILTGGFPCQPYSQAGKRLGKEDERHLWPEMLRAIREIKPTWVVGENVFGLTNWNGGVVFEEVWADLEAEAYTVQPFILPAAGVEAPHGRYRVWFVAYCGHARQERPTPDSESKRCEPLNQDRTTELSTQRKSGIYGGSGNRNDAPPGWQNFPTQPPVCSRNDGLSDQLDGITLPKWRKESIKAYGNAIVPQVALQIFKAIQAYETTHNS